MLVLPVVTKLGDPFECVDIINLQFLKVSNNVLCMDIDCDESTKSDGLQLC